MYCTSPTFVSVFRISDVHYAAAVAAASQQQMAYSRDWNRTHLDCRLQGAGHTVWTVNTCDRKRCGRDTSLTTVIVESFFALLEKLHVFVSGATAHKVWLDTQKAMFPDEAASRQLQRLSDTRWRCTGQLPVETFMIVLK